ncbi:germination protein M [Keratinibaculum paraultunense]|uniref:Germination protein M n=1 Tax=Keratinibaculum paraultunense TaxID=1278232 RepID=A0A4R3KYY6_9FIRM|nr:GerMN domain-containing protein [Keratinibaculum paraultunense]QQY80203.1 GerMN domain-containing protein [Keratinibaculum paraultunense]TCS90714.1 germination protein M [Keratinibaculum paraultunense]
MNNKKIKVAFLIILITLIAVSCKSKEGFKKLFSKEEELEIIRSDDLEFEITDESGMRRTILYFKDKQGLLVPLMKKIPWEEGIAKSALENMIDSPELRESIAATGLIPIIPAGTEIRGMTIDEETGLCKVDFSKEVLNYETEKDEENLIKGVVYTLTEFQSIDEVQFLVDGEPIPVMKYGTDMSNPIKRENINLALDTEDQRSKIVVYYKGVNYEEDYEYFVPITIPTLAPIPNVYTALEVLFDGPPMDLGLSSYIPQGTSFHGVDIKNGIAYIDISFDYGDPPNDPQVFNNMIKNIGLTLSEFDEVEKVELLIDGKGIEELGLEFNIDTAIPAFANEY